MNFPVSLFIGLRYARTGKGSHFIAFINLFSVVGIALGLMSLITVASVMNGFELQLKNRLLGIMPHIIVDTRGSQDVGNANKNLSAIKGVDNISPFIESEGVLQSKRGIQGIIIQGVDPVVMEQNSVIAKNMKGENGCCLCS